MVWYINNYKSWHFMHGPHFGFKQLQDRFFQTGNIMLDLSKQCYDAAELHYLISTGVNIFNVDFTVHEIEFLKDIEEAIADVENTVVMFPEKYAMPISVSVTMSVKNPVKITKRTDFIILKDVTELKEVIEFRNLSPEHKSIPILLWIGILETEATNELIKISNGIILDVQNGVINQLYYYFIQKCFKECRPVFYSNPDIIEEYYGRTANDRKLIMFAELLVQNRFQGVVVKDSNELNYTPTEFVHSLVKAIHIVECNVDVDKDFYKKSFDLKIPALPPITVAYAASLAAIQSKASAIIVITATGQSAKTMSFAAPTCHVIAITTRKKTARRLHLYRRVIPLLYERERGHSWRDECRNRIGFGTAFALSTRLLGAGAKLVVLAPAEEASGYCDGVQIISVPFSCEE